MSHARRTTYDDVKIRPTNLATYTDPDSVSHSYRNPIINSCRTHKTRFIFELMSTFVPSRDTIDALAHRSRGQYMRSSWGPDKSNHARDTICTRCKRMTSAITLVHEKTMQMTACVSTWTWCIDWQASAKQGLKHWIALRGMASHTRSTNDSYIGCNNIIK